MGHGPTDEPKVKPQFSRSRSGITKDGQAIALVYRISEGQYSKPIKLSRTDAISVAKKFQSTGRGDSSLKVTSSAAKFIFKHARHAGWLSHSEQVDTVEALREGTIDDSDSQTSIGRESLSDEEIASLFKPSKSVRPVYLPELHPLRSVEIDDEIVADVAFILSGIDPSKCRDAKLIEGEITLKALAKTPSGERVSATQFLRNDHRHALYHLSGLTESQFDEVIAWGKNPASGQENTDLRKLSRIVEQFDSTEPAKQLADPDLRSKFGKIRAQSPKLLFRNFKAARRDIAQLHERNSEPENPTKKSAANLIARFRMMICKPENIRKELVDIDPEVLEITRSYLMWLCNLGRILRSDAVRRG